MTAQADIDALIHRADTEYRTVDKDKRADFAGVTAMAGLTILAKHIDGLAERIDGMDAGRDDSRSRVEEMVAGLRRDVDSLTDEVRRYTGGPG
jgi:hypothetical protein